MSAETAASTTAPAPRQFTVARSVEIARLRWAADLVGDAGIRAYGTRVLPVQGGAQ